MVLNISLNEKEVNELIELLYLGRWIANAEKLQDERIQKYDDLFRTLTNALTNGKDENDLHYYLEEFIDAYNADVMPREFAKQYADYVYPFKLSDFSNAKEKALRQSIANKVLKEFCEKEFRKNGFKNISINLPNLEQVIEGNYRAFKKTLDN